MFKINGQFMEDQMLRPILDIARKTPFYYMMVLSVFAGAIVFSILFKIGIDLSK